MSNHFETLLRAGLEHGAEQAPNAAGLASGARDRARTRRRNRIVAGVAAAVVAIGVPIAVVAAGGDDTKAVDPADPAPSYDVPWQTVESDDALADLPGDWTEHECTFDGESDGFTVYGPPDLDACGYDVAMTFYGSATFDPSELPGVVTQEGEGDSVRWSGYVNATDDQVAYAVTPDRDLTLQILASARAEGEVEVVADEWEHHEQEGMTWIEPRRWEPNPTGDPTYGVSIVDRPAGEKVVQSLPTHGMHGGVRMHGDVGAFRVKVTAPTRAVAELVLSSFEARPRPNG